MSQSTQLPVVSEIGIIELADGTYGVGRFTLFKYFLVEIKFVGGILGGKNHLKHSSDTLT